MAWKFYGWNAHHGTPIWDCRESNFQPCSGYYGGGFAPTTAIRDAWEVVGRLKELAGDSRSDLWHHFVVALGFDIDKHEPDEMWGLSPLRITQAALEAVRVTKPEVKA